MLKIVFKNIEPSQMARDILVERITPALKKIPSLKDRSVMIKLEMENSPSQEVPDFFTLSLRASGKANQKDLVIKKSSENFYHATAALAESLNKLVDQETICRKGEKHE